MPNFCCEESPPVLKPEPLDIRCQILGPQGRCPNWALLYVHYTNFDVDLAVCERHLLTLPREVAPLADIGQSDAERLYKEARQFDEWVEELNDPKRAVRRDAGAVAAPSHHVPPVR